jgi:hypothetical protein
VRYTVWYAGRLIGTTALDGPSVSPGLRGGDLEPSDAFAEVWPDIGSVFREMREVTQSLFSDTEFKAEIRAHASLSKDERGQRVHEVVVAHPLSQRLREAHARAKALPLEIQDEDGQVIPCTVVVVQEVTPPDFIPPDEFQQAMADAAEAGFPIRWPHYVITIAASQRSVSSSVSS